MAIAILVADDSPTVRRALIRSIPADLGAHVAEAHNGAEALEACRAAMPDVLFLDLTMPVADGFAVLAALQSEPRRPHVVVVSTDATPAARASLLALGAAEILSKPWHPGQIEGVLRRLVAL